MKTGDRILLWALVIFLPVLLLVSNASAVAQQDSLESLLERNDVGPAVGKGNPPKVSDAELQMMLKRIRGTFGQPDKEILYRVPKTAANTPLSVDLPSFIKCMTTIPKLPWEQFAEDYPEVNAASESVELCPHGIPVGQLCTIGGPACAKCGHGNWMLECPICAQIIRDGPPSGP